MNTNHAKKWDHSSTVTMPKRNEQVKVKVRKQGWITKGEKILYALVGSGLIAAAFFIVSNASANDTLNREIQSLENTIQEQQIVNESLLFEKKELSKPERITKIARKNGLKIPETEVRQAQTYNSN